jgi:hypothetical protein
MSFCPNKDVHSIYLDNEMPEIYVAEYEAHLKNCPKCQAELAKLKRVHSLLKEDSNTIQFANERMADSFDKLQMKLAYSKHTNRHSETLHENVRTFVPFAAAAAILAVVLPFNLSRTGKKAILEEETPIEQVAMTNSVSAGNNVSFGNNFNVSSTPVISIDNHRVIVPLEKNTLMNPKKRTDNKLIKDVGLFRPDFEEEKTVSIKISVPGINMDPVTTEIELPVNILAGLFE